MFEDFILLLIKYIHFLFIGVNKFNPRHLYSIFDF